MGFVLHAGPFHALEKQFCGSFIEALAGRANALQDTHLVLTPSSELRRRLLRLLHEAGSPSLFNVRFVSLNGLAREIVLDSVESRELAIDDSVYFALVLQASARHLNLKHFESYRTCKALLSTFRDMVDGLLTPELLRDFLDQSTADPELRASIGDPRRLQELTRLFDTFLATIKRQNILNVQFASALAINFAPAWLQAKNVTAIHMYGFYDATPAQFDLLQALARTVRSRDGAVEMYFPFAADSNSIVAYPANYAQPFFDELRSFTVSAGGSFHPVDSEGAASASAGLERHLFRHVPDDVLKGIQENRNIEIFNAGSAYDEAWAVAKRIVHLVLNEGARFDQIGVITRSLEVSRLPLLHAFAQNCIPNTIETDTNLGSNPAGQLMYLLLRCRQSNLNHNVIFELLCSPLIKQPFSPAGLIRELLDMLFITNSNDWNRLKPLLNEQRKLPDIFEIDENDWRSPHYRRAAAYLLALKQQIEQIPQRATIARYASALRTLIAATADPVRLEEAGGVELDLLLERMTQLPLNTDFSLAEFVEIAGDYLGSTLVEAKQNEAEARVAVGDVMSLRGASFDYTFLIGVNQDVFPVRVSEDPFLPDSIRRLLRSYTGAGPHPKRPHEIASADAADEELLLFSLALQAAGKKAYLSYLRADSEGRRQSPSIYIEEAMRLLTGRTTEGNTEVDQVPRHPALRFGGQFFPTPFECATLPGRFSLHEIVPFLYDLPSDYITSTVSFARKLNGIERMSSMEVDGYIPDAAQFWKEALPDRIRFSYSRIKAYVQCPYSFFSDRILRLESSPFEPTEVAHDLTPLVKGRIAESVVKDAVVKIRQGRISIDDAVEECADRIARKYSPYLPKVLIDHYMIQFARAARTLLHYLQQEGYDFRYAEAPERNYMPEIELVRTQDGALFIYGIPDLLIYGPKRLIGEMKWGASATMETADAMFKRGEFQFCFYPELERQHRHLLDPADFRYFRLNAFADIGSPAELEYKLREYGAPKKIDTTLRIFGLAPSNDDIQNNFQKLRDVGARMLHGDFPILEDPGDFFTPCTRCRFILICRRTHSKTLLRAKQEQRNNEGTDSDVL